MSFVRRSSSRLTSNNNNTRSKTSTTSTGTGTGTGSSKDKKFNRNHRLNQNDTMTSLLQKLPPIYRNEIPTSLHDKLLSKSREKLRLLNSKTTRGQSLCKGDSIETRSAVVLEYVLRQGLKLEDGSVTATIRVPLDVLGKFVGVQKKEIEKLASTVGFYLKQIDLDVNSNGNSNNDVRHANNSTGASHKKNISLVTTKRTQVMDVHRRYAARFSNLSSSSKQSILNNQSNNTKNISNSILNKTIRSNDSRKLTTNNIGRSANTHHPEQLQNEQKQIQSLFSSSLQNNIHSLSIKLQSYLHDPNAIEHKSNNLWWNIIQCKVKNSTTRRAAIYDLQSNVSHYEGACFYYTVSDLELGTCSRESTRSSTTNKSSIGINEKRNKNSKSKVTNGKLDNEMAQYNNQNNNANKDNIDEDIEDNILTIDDVIHELRIDAGLFSEIYEEVSVLASKMGEQKYVEHNTSRVLPIQTTKKRARIEGGIKTDVNDSFSSNNNDHNDREEVHYKKSKLNEGDGVVVDSGDNDSFNGSKADFETMPSSFKPNYIAKNQFMEWKDKVLQSITSKCDQGQYKTRNNSSSSLSTQYGREAVRKYANIILEKYNDSKY